MSWLVDVAYAVVLAWLAGGLLFGLWLLGRASARGSRDYLRGLRRLAK